MGVQKLLKTWWLFLKTKVVLVNTTEPIDLCTIWLNILEVLLLVCSPTDVSFHSPLLFFSVSFALGVLSTSKDILQVLVITLRDLFSLLCLVLFWKGYL